MQESKFSFHLYGSEIFGCHVEPKVVTGVVVLVHGFGEHSGRYKAAVIPILTDLGLGVVTYDNIGHGKSGGKRGHCPSYEALLDILATVIDKAKELHPKKPLFLYGHSMGGNLVLNYALRRKEDFAGIIATSPYLRLAFKPPKWKMFLGKMLLKVLPSVTLPSGLDANGISRNPEEVTKYQNDSMIYDAVSPMYSFPVMDAGEWALANAHTLNCEALLLHGTRDQIIDHTATIEFHQKASNTTLKLYEGGYHELHHDLCKEAMLEDIHKWLKERI
ncbi:alpha/beta hydrolase [Aggregatimonas sangjinii]|uniref:Alpha/beta hydrolase n=1 Tax=Aggregatimonas sangjinii TaxID=2583587 RepID=A0A5B7SN66_9FLAO|nr:alpha/beta hydrolase [Aggregatimonas sangjinii]QCX00095.1 alpha/beta hydrolase [Aggregatimonas sangjinii]